MLDDDYTAKIRHLNDEFRRDLGTINGSMFLTAGVRELDPDDQLRLLLNVQNYDSFRPENDPHGEHDFGALDFQSILYFWKIDYYDNDLKYHSRNPANLSVTHRVLTIMQADDY